MKVEEVSLKPSIILVHDLVNSVQTRRIVRKTARKLVGNDGGPSTSFKRLTFTFPFYIPLQQLHNLPFWQRIVR